MGKYNGVFPLRPGDKNTAWGYRLRVTIDGEVYDTSRRKDKDGKPFLTARSAYEAKMAHEAEIRGQVPEKRKQKATLAQIYRIYLDSADGKSKAPATLRKQDSIWRNHISPKFGARDINTIILPEWESYLFDLYDQGYAYRYVEGHLKIIYLLYSVAHKHELISGDKYYKMFVDRSTRLQMPKKRQEDVEDDLEGAEIYTDYELAQIRRVLSSEDGNLLVSYYIGIYTGVRVSECFAIRWRDIDWGKRTIRINRQMHYQNSRIELCAVKTMTAIREVPMPRTLAEFLRHYLEAQIEDRKRLGQAYRDTERVYDTVTREWLTGADFVQRKQNGELLTVNSVKYWSKKIKADAGITFKFHNLRHTFASNCAAANISLMTLMGWMGHKKVDTTRQYYINTDQDAMRDKALRVVDAMYDLDTPAENVWDPNEEERKIVELESELALLRMGIKVKKDS